MSFYGWDSPDVVYLYSASGKKLMRVQREMQVCEFVWKNPEFVFDTGEPNAKAKVEAETGGFRFEFGSDVQPQHISDAYETFIGMSNKRQMYLDRHHEKKKKVKTDKQSKLNDADEDPFSSFKGLSAKEIEYLNSYKDPSVDELIAEMEKMES